MKEVIATLHRIGEDVIALADYLAAYYAKPTEEETPTEVKAEKSVVKLEDVRTVLAEISRSGKTAEMKALLGKFGAVKLSEVKPEDYAALLEAAQEVKNA